MPWAGMALPRWGARKGILQSPNRGDLITAQGIALGLLPVQGPKP
jgi:hypothetical protein